MRDEGGTCRGPATSRRGVSDVKSHPCRSGGICSCGGACGAQDSELERLAAAIRLIVDPSRCSRDLPVLQALRHGALRVLKYLKSGSPRYADAEDIIGKPGMEALKILNVRYRIPGAWYLISGIRQRDRTQCAEGIRAMFRHQGNRLVGQTMASQFGEQLANAMMIQRNDLVADHLMQLAGSGGRRGTYNVGPAQPLFSEEWWDIIQYGSAIINGVAAAIITGDTSKGIGYGLITFYVHQWFFEPFVKKVFPPESEGAPEVAKPDPPTGMAGGIPPKCNFECPNSKTSSPCSKKLQVCALKASPCFGMVPAHQLGKQICNCCPGLVCDVFDTGLCVPSAKQPFDGPCPPPTDDPLHGPACWWAGGCAVASGKSTIEIDCVDKDGWSLGGPGGMSQDELRLECMKLLKGLPSKACRCRKRCKL